MIKKTITMVVLLTLSMSITAQTNKLSTAGTASAASGGSTIIPFGTSGNVVVDGGFEGGTPNAAWTEASSTFGTTLCDLGSCGTGTGTGPNSGAFWSWFGGIAASEVGSVTQDVTIPSGTATLEFFTELIICDSAADFMEAQIDGTTVFRIQGDDPTCGNLGYVLQSVDVSAFADDGLHTLAFTSEIFANNGNGTNFFLDDVSLVSVPPPAVIPSLQWYGIALLILALFGFGFRKKLIS
jgi:hypothetical protein